MAILYSVLIKQKKVSTIQRKQIIELNRNVGIKACRRYRYFRHKISITFSVEIIEKETIYIVDSNQFTEQF